MMGIMMAGGTEMKYNAIYEIDCGVSPGFGVKYPDRILVREEFEADSQDNARINALRIAARFARDYLSNPDTGYTAVEIVSIRDRDGNIVSQEPLLEKIRGLEFKKGCAVIKCSIEEHLLMLALEDSKKS